MSVANPQKILRGWNENVIECNEIINEAVIIVCLRDKYLNLFWSLKNNHMKQHID